MPATYRETIKDGKPRFEVITGFDWKTKAPYWSSIGLPTARELLNNETAFKEFVRKHNGSTRA